MPTTPTPPDNASATPNVAARPRRGRRAARWLGLSTLLLLVLAVAAVAALLTSLRTPKGTAWWLANLPGVQAMAPQGALLGDFSTESVQIGLSGGGAVKLTGLSWRGLAVRWSSLPGHWLDVSASALSVQRLEVVPGSTPAPPSAPLKAPAHLRLPATLQIDAIQIDEIHMAALGNKPLRNLRGRLALGANRGAQHQLALSQLEWDEQQLSGSAQVDSGGDMAINAQLDVAQPASRADAALRTPALQGRIVLSGPLTQPTLQATLTTTAAAPDKNTRLAPAAATALTPAPSLQASAVLQPFAPWPLPSLDARWEQLDLSVLAATAPRTLLSGQAKVSSPAQNQLADVQLTLANPRAGRWSDGLLPLRQLTLALQVPTDQPQQASLRQLRAELGTDRQAAGQIEVQGQSRPEGWVLTTQLSNVQPALLDARAPALRLSGPLDLQGNGFLAKEDAKVNAKAAPQTLALKANLTGSLANTGRGPNAAQNVSLAIDANGSMQADGAMALLLQRAQLVAGAAGANIKGTLSRGANTAAGPAKKIATQSAPWQAKAEARLTQFDPLLWWPGAQPAAQRGVTRINANAKVDVTLAAPASGNAVAPPTATSPAAPANAPAQALWHSALAAFGGQAQLDLNNSLLNGVPVQAAITLDNPPAAAGSANARLDLAGNELTLTARVAKTGSAADNAELSINAPSLQRLQALLALLPAEAKHTVPAKALLAGQIQGKASARGRWPDVNTQGELTAQSLQAGPVSLQRGDLRWQLGSALDAAMALQADLAQLVVQGQVTNSLRATVQGTARAHTLVLQANTSLPPLRSATSGGAPAAPKVATPAVAQIRLQGGLTHSAPPATTSAAQPSDNAGLAGSSAWRGMLQQIEFGEARPAAPPWLKAQNIGLAFQWSDTALGVDLTPGKVDFRVGDTVSALRWSSASWQQTGAQPGDSATTRFDVQATLDPLSVTPVLARLQPDFGWAGDLTVGGRVSLKSAPAVTADIVLERQKGDLQITDDDGTQALGLTDLRLALNASNGVWNFTQALAGQSVGVAAGAIVARTSPQAVWPGADTPVQGVVELRVANLAAWASWVPTGWRLGGSLQTSASIAGRLGAPELTGQVRGQGLSARNVLQGVNVTDGDLAINMTGDNAKIERFTARAGDGTLRLTGGAALGAVPSAQIQVLADKFQVLGRVDLRIVTSGQAKLVLAANRVALDGQFVVDEGLVDFTRSDAPSLSDDVVVLRATPGKAGAAVAPAVANAGPKATPRALALNLGIGLGEQLRLKGRGLSTRLQGDLKLTSPNGLLALNGAVRTVGGYYDAYGQQLTIDRGVVTFTGAVENPRLDIEATRPKTDIRVGVTVVGTALNPRIRLFSEPDLPDVDKLSWLVLGRASTGLGRTDTALLQRAAVALFAGEEEGMVTKLTRSIGLDELSLRQTDGEVRETIVSLGKQLSERLYLGYERGLNSTAGNFQLIYRIAQRFTLRGQTGQDNAVDLIFTRRWQ